MARLGTAARQGIGPSRSLAGVAPMSLPVNEIICGDCLEVMRDWPDKCVDLVLTDLPYGTTSNKWDSVIPFAPLWTEYLRICKPRAAFIFTASQPFTSLLISSQSDLFRHEWIWIKNRGSNFANTVREPMKEHESVLVFSRGKWVYNKQMQARTGSGNARAKYNVAFRSQSENYRAFIGREKTNLSKLRVPSSWQKFNTEVGLHPTQKPLSLGEYFIQNYSDKEHLILDNACGSATFCKAAQNLGRNYIGIDISSRYCQIARQRLEAVDTGVSVKEQNQGQIPLFPTQKNDE
ncbi:hypothetical protein LCGC14_3166720 [marine sediment metagenome]|uniref:DNA methylase N-4/N-6 domain-containing protein n=1 Tax=marine sediment metagenome TaxID=412755 RepID=A0A0F8XRJ2_9ZZZZ